MNEGIVAGLLRAGATAATLGADTAGDSSADATDDVKPATAITAEVSRGMMMRRSMII
jgi:hypothetical protein